MSHDPYVYPGSEVLRNARDIRNAEELRQAEADLTEIRVALLARRRIEGHHDLKHLQAFHRFLFEGFYDWAGDTRTLDIARTQRFCLVQHIPTFAAHIFGRLAAQRHLRDLGRDDFVVRLAEHLGEVNALHPFREGNGRAQRAFFAQLAGDAGYRIDWARIDPDRNEHASMKSLHEGNNEPLREMLDSIVEPLQ